MGFDWKKTLSAVAPTIATAIGGPFGGVAAKAALSALGMESTGNPDRDQDELAAVIAGADPSTLATLRQVENDFKVQMKELGIRETELRLQDVGGARDLAKTKGLIVQASLSVVFVVGYFSVFAILLGQFFGESPVKLQPEANTILSILLGAMTKAISDILQFWFGSSAGSARKNETIERMKEGR